MSQQTPVDRLRVLVDAGIALSSELSLDALLQQLVETAAQLTGARYAALGVIDSTGQGLERFLTTGIDPETHAAIGDLPRGRGILGVLIRDAQASAARTISATTLAPSGFRSTTRRCGASSAFRSCFAASRTETCI